MEGGFASRILFVIENELPDSFVAIPKPNAHAKQMRQRLLEDLWRIHSLCGEVRFTAEAEHHFTAWYEAHMRSIQQKRHSAKFAGYYGRKATQVEKLSIIASVSDNDTL